MLNQFDRLKAKPPRGAWLVLPIGGFLASVALAEFGNARPFVQILGLTGFAISIGMLSVGST